MLTYVVFAESVGCAKPQTSCPRALGRGTRFRGFLHQDIRTVEYPSRTWFRGAYKLGVEDYGLQIDTELWFRLRTYWDQTGRTT